LQVFTPALANAQVNTMVTLDLPRQQKKDASAKPRRGAGLLPQQAVVPQPTEVANFTLEWLGTAHHVPQSAEDDPAQVGCLARIRRSRAGKKTSVVVVISTGDVSDMCSDSTGSGRPRHHPQLPPQSGPRHSRVLFHRQQHLEEQSSKVFLQNRGTCHNQLSPGKFAPAVAIGACCCMRGWWL
jgi:hypothetical protein